MTVVAKMGDKIVEIMRFATAVRFSALPEQDISAAREFAKVRVTTVLRCLSGMPLLKAFDISITNKYNNNMNTPSAEINEPDQTIMVVQQPVWPFQGRMIDFKIKPDGVEFNVCPGTPQSEIHWLLRSVITDVAYLSQEFRELKVYEFEALCKGLAHIHNNIYPFWGNV